MANAPPAASFGKWLASPDPGAATDASTAEIAGLIPSRRTPLRFVGNRMGHQTPHGQYDQRPRDLRNENDRHQKSDRVLLKRNQPEEQ
jgi:hypothetical protein